MTSTEACSDFITEDCTRNHISSWPKFEICTTPRFWHSVPGSFSWLSAYFLAIIQLIIIFCPLFTPVVSPSIDFGSCNCPQTMLMLLIDRTLFWTQEAPITLSLFELEPNWCPIIDIAMDWCNRHVQAPTSLYRLFHSTDTTILPFLHLSQLFRHHCSSGLVVNTRGMIFRLWLQSRVRKFWW